MLEKLNFKSFLEAENGAEALKVLDSNSNINFIFLDVNMPVLDGKRVLRVLRGDERYYQTPIIMITGDHSNSEESVQKNLEKLYSTKNSNIKRTGFTEFLYKPINAALLQEKIQLLTTIKR
jgi:CheY-like chemotaxis protein